jgi:hypothetical protein
VTACTSAVDDLKLQRERGQIDRPRPISVVVHQRRKTVHYEMSCTSSEDDLKRQWERVQTDRLLIRCIYIGVTSKDR